MNYLWPAIIIISFLYSLKTGKIEDVNIAIFSSMSNVVELSLTLVGNMCLWCGIMKIIQSTSLMNKISKFLKPILNWLFIDVKNDEKTMDDISINTVSNILGIGNAATPAGLKAMEDMQESNKNKGELTDSMVMLIVLNTASIQILPTTIIAIRSSLGSTNPANIIIPIWISTIVGTFVGVLVTKILLKNSKKKL